MIGCDIREANETTQNILLNKDLLAINQDVEGRGAYRIKPEPQWFHDDDVFIQVKVLSDGDLAIGFFNLSDAQREIPFSSGIWVCPMRQVIPLIFTTAGITSQ